MQGILRKMKTTLATPVDYQLPVGDQWFPLNHRLGQSIEFTASGKIFCIQCGRKTNKSFQQGYCYLCYRRLMECGLCIVHPERCQVEKKGCPHDDWAHSHCHQEHIIYLANTSGLKIGITRSSQVPTRWIDQGAVQAVPLWRVSNRYRAGVIEVACKAWINDKTHWRNLLKNQVDLIDLDRFKQEFLLKIKDTIKIASATFADELRLMDDSPLILSYPIKEFPEKITSLSLDKTPTIRGVLLGIKGQYLLLDKGVLNVRKFGGYEVTLN